MKHLLSFIAVLLLTISCKAQTSVSIIAPKSLLDSSITAITISDVQQLIGQACDCKVTLNDASARIVIKLPEINSTTAAQLNHFAQKATFPYRNYPEHGYTWNIRSSTAQMTYELTTASLQGVSFGLYGLLQEHLGFKFYHPRRSIIPHFANGWPIVTITTFSGAPLFDKKGFHIHSQHPLELTEQLLDPAMPHALEDVKEYINWLARNGQTYFEFCLLNDIDRDLWPAHAKAFVDYGHSRGILMGVDMSLHMIQQKTFQLYKGPVSKEKQIDKNLAWLMQADWDYLSMEFSTAEFIGGNVSKKEALRQHVLAWLQKNSHAKLTGRRHVAQHTGKPGKYKEYPWDSTSIALDKQRGVMPHTVMFYDMTEPNAPVYENKNQQHMFKFLLEQMKQRETWYYPESAYWITFDNSIPLTLLPYLSARLSDIDTCAKYGVPGHLTFSSGWEWGYWLFDWSIARWSWQYSYNGHDQLREPTMYVREASSWLNESRISKAMKAQQQYLKDSTLMQWMTAMTITDEISIKALANEYEPRPHWSYKYLQRKANDSVITAVRTRILPQLKEFSMQSLAAIGNGMLLDNPDSIITELEAGTVITATRAMHRYYTLSYILARRDAKLHHQKFDGDSLLQKAIDTRMYAQKIVNDREKKYRYPVELIARKRWDHTAYHFGYLYLASNLHLWQREEEEARKNKYSPWFMNVWNVGRIVGFIK